MIPVHQDRMRVCLDYTLTLAVFHETQPSAFQIGLVGIAALAQTCVTRAQCCSGFNPLLNFRT